MSELTHQSNCDYEVHFLARLILRDDAYRNGQPSPRWSDLTQDTRDAYLLLARQRIEVWDKATPVRR
ncbi:hypothetical protein [Spirosoma pomorum]